jgi:hypothetical protein
MAGGDGKVGGGAPKFDPRTLGYGFSSEELDLINQPSVDANGQPVVETPAGETVPPPGGQQFGTQDAFDAGELGYNFTPEELALVNAPAVDENGQPIQPTGQTQTQQTGAPSSTTAQGTEQAFDVSSLGYNFSADELALINAPAVQADGFTPAAEKKVDLANGTDEQKRQADELSKMVTDMSIPKGPAKVQGSEALMRMMAPELYEGVPQKQDPNWDQYFGSSNTNSTPRPMTASQIQMANGGIKVG